MPDTAGPIIVWENYGHEGWHPRSFATFVDAVTAGAITRESCVTTRLDVAKHIIEPVDKSPGDAVSPPDPG